MLLEAIKNKATKQDIGNILSFLASYVIEHFGMEEKIMEQTKFPNMAMHKKQHAEFINKYNEIKSKFDAEGATLEVSIDIQTYLGGWLLKHIPVFDKELSAYVKSDSHA